MNLQQFSQEFDKRFFVFTHKKIKSYKMLAKDKDIEAFIEHVDLYLQGGKRLRPYSIYIGILESGKKLQDSHWLVMIAVELIHALALIHDDVIDKALTRRDVPSINGFIEKNQKIVRGDKTHYSNSQAILVGDLLYAAAFQALSESKASQDVFSEIIQLLDEVIVGQMIDVKLASYPQADTKLITRKTKYKTALYTFSRPFQIGCLLGKVSEDTQKKMFSIGEQIGILFQVQDDYLDMFGSEQILKKEIMNDIREGQQTLLTDHFLKHATEDQKNIFMKFYGTSFSSKHNKVLQALFEETGTKMFTYKEMEKSFKKIRKSIEIGNFSKKTTEAFLDVLNRLEARM